MADRRDKLAADLAALATLSPAQLREQWRKVTGRVLPRVTPDPGLVKLLAKARERWSHIAQGDIDISTLAKQEGVNDSWMSRVMRLNFLAPSINDAILNGTQPVTLTAARLRSDDFPIEWERQWESLAG